MDFVLVEVDFCQPVCVYGYVCVYRIMQLSLYVRVCVLACAYTLMRICVYVYIQMCAFVCFFLFSNSYQ